MKSFWLALGSAALIANAPAFAQTSSATHPQVLLKTTDGDIKVELYPEQAPKTVANFLDYVKSGQYSGTIFHRVIKGFMIQGGGYTASFAEKPTRVRVENAYSPLTTGSPRAPRPASASSAPRTLPRG